ncbi:MAG TPA: hypothetical protein VIM12_18715 [Noviherbaspirillum sp.]|jgi:hypothetical protein|uniref:hypothetical protein n=1 Tax=Noviherbaspirillum sp. TaxID=1926288 RepID=UPI002F93D557
MLVLVAAAMPADARTPPVEQQAAALFGLEYAAVAPGAAILPGRSSCTEAGESMLLVEGAEQSGWTAGAADCGGRRVALLKRRMGEQDGRVQWRIEDVLLLPPMAPERARPRRLARPEECALADGADTSFLAVLRERRPGDDRPPVVEQLWTYDLARGRLLRQPASQLACTGHAPD